jgi:putative aminopeptidase FrvX
LAENFISVCNSYWKVGIIIASSWSFVKQNLCLRQYITDVAARESIPVQHAVFLGGLGETSYAAVVREGIPAVDMAFPARYTHAPIEVGSLPDMEQLIALLVAAVEGVDSKLDLSRG